MRRIGELLRRVFASPSRRRHWSLGLGLAAALLVLGVVSIALLIGPLVRWQVHSQAERRGLKVSVGSVELGFGRVSLSNLSVVVPELPGVSAEFDAVEARFGPTLGLRGVSAHGGRLWISGSPDELAEKLKAWRGARANGDGQGTRLAYALDGVDVTWEKASPKADPAFAWGLRYLVQPDGAERVGADLVRVGTRNIAADCTRPEVVLRREGGRRTIERLVAAGADVRIRLKSAATKAATPETPAMGPSLGPGPDLRKALQRLGSSIAEHVPEAGRLELGQLRLEVGQGPQALSLGPAQLTLTRTRDRARLVLSPGNAEQRTPLALRLDLPLGEGAVQAEIAGGPVSLAALGVREGSLGLREVARAELEARTKLELSPDGRHLTFVATGQTKGLSLEHRKLAPQLLRGINLGWSGQGEAEIDGSRLRIDQGEFTLGNVHLTAKSEIERAADYTKLRLEVAVPLASCQDLLDALPTGLLPLLAGIRASGLFGLDTLVEFDTRHPGDTRVRWKMRDECRITSVPEAISLSRFQRPWERQVLGADGEKMTIESGPGTPTWVPRNAITNYLEVAVLICEDGGFHHHAGFDSEAIANALRDNLKSGNFVRGASTISMQAAKNLYLAREKTLSRKMQEAVLTRLLEQELTKDQILELYFNVIEFGPGIYGIGPAAEYYFKSTPGQLSLSQALFLGSILPSPKRQRFMASGELHPGWAAYLRTLMQIAYKRHLITDQELEQGLREQVILHQPAPGRAPDVAAESATDEVPIGGVTPPADGPENQ